MPSRSQSNQRFASRPDPPLIVYIISHLPPPRAVLFLPSSNNSSRQSITTLYKQLSHSNKQLSPPTTIKMETIKNAGNYVADKVNAATSEASKTTNKEVAKDSNASAGTRLDAAGNAISDKFDEKKHEASAETNKQKATH
ncbi:hypothetical protein QC761_211900 [Podospora bellae-mahoneyi]|uniref:Glucose-repressible protein n=1 Tax=Podospora bellae-mahoneyi TaxID=2093777 RepID=A0ABR0FRK0_9PEZI|nr:hypothetical protein QC761_211900 [Podospora bellae-mahoneyi]